MTAYDPLYFLPKGSAMTQAVASYDWTQTPLGPLEHWPVALKTAAGMMLNSHFPKCITWGPELITIYNDAFRPILGDKPEALGRSFRDVWAEVWSDIGPIAEKAFSGEATFIEDFPLIINRFGYEEQVYFTFCYSPIYDETGSVAGMMDTVIETTGKVDAERQSAILNSELAHRIKNMLATVSALANQTLNNSETIEAARTSLGQRFSALASAHALLTNKNRSDAAVTEVVQGAILPHSLDSDRFSMSGPSVGLPERQALALSLAINELATNALKYGALSTPEGRVAIEWAVGRQDADRVFMLDWRESGGPIVVRPTRRSFGTMLIEKLVAEEFSGEAEINYNPEGVHYRIRTNSSNLER